MHGLQLALQNISILIEHETYGVYLIHIARYTREREPAQKAVFILYRIDYTTVQYLTKRGRKQKKKKRKK